MKKIVKILIFFVVTIIVSTFCPIHLDTFFVSTLYTVVGFMFSIGLSLVVTFNIGNVKNPTYIRYIRNNIHKIRSNFIIYFLSSTICYITNYYFDERLKEQLSKALVLFNIQTINIQFDFSLLASIVILYSIAYIIVNFIAMQKLNDELFDKTNL